jgi:hypothetical protein
MFVHYISIFFIHPVSSFELALINIPRNKSGHGTFVPFSMVRQQNISMALLSILIVAVQIAIVI